VPRQNLTARLISLALITIPARARTPLFGQILAGLA
jgi:hypothetical protein